MKTQTTIGITRCQDYVWPEVKEEVERTVDALGGFGAFIPKGAEVLLKANLLSAREVDHAVTTHPLIVRAVAELVMEAGGKPFIADSPSLSTARRVSAKCGIGAVADELGIAVREFSRGSRVIAEQHSPFSEYLIAPEALKADVVINLPKIKTHTQMLLTLCVKNMFGCVPGKLKAQWHLRAGSDRDTFAAMLLDIYRFVNPALTIVDGVVGMEGDGPNAGTPRKLGWLMAGTDCVALDVLISAMLGLKEDLSTTRVARKHGIGIFTLEDIDVIGCDWNSLILSDFHFPSLSDVDFPMPPFLKRFLKRGMTTYPRVDSAGCELCMACVEICPVHAATMENEKISIDLDRCIRCYCCQETCPAGAIYLKKGWLQRIMRL